MVASWVVLLLSHLKSSISLRPSESARAEDRKTGRAEGLQARSGLEPIPGAALGPHSTGDPRTSPG